MFAVVKTGGKQYRVAKDDLIRVEKLDATVGDKIIFDQVLMVSDENGAQTGAPVLEGATVEAEVIDQMRDKKVIIYKKKRRQNYRRKKGHRQHLTVLQIQNIALKGAKAKTKSAAKKAEAAPAEEAAAPASDA